ncbi:GNAT family N-acetyltransferase [Candidatus Micrarchaeota archaeon]|nr:GNAT family N-acetyltransferase [Candidatus Micrarchaeota archaeon]
MQIREATGADAEEIGKLLSFRLPRLRAMRRKLHVEIEVFRPDPKNGRYRKVTGADEARNILAREGVKGFVAETEGAVVGFVAAEERELKGRKGPHFFFHALAVKEGSNAGRALLEAVKREGISRQFSHAYFHVDALDAKLHRYYRMRGAQEIGAADTPKLRLFRLPTKRL